MYEYMKKNKINHFNEREAVFFLQQIMNGFQKLREWKILHRDFKLENIFIDFNKVLIGDFGFAKIGQEFTNTVLGTPITMAPELLLSKEEEGVIYNSKADLWSIGVVYYEMLFGKLPYTGKGKEDLSREVVLCQQVRLGF